MTTTTLTLPIPPSMNNYYQRSKNGGIHVSNNGKVFREEVHIICLNEQVPLLEGEIHFTVNFYFVRDKDIDNCLKPLQDALNGYAWVDDKQITKLIVTKHRVKRGEKCEVVIEEISKPLKQKALL